MRPACTTYRTKREYMNCMGKQINFLFYFLILDFDAFRLWQNEL